MAGQRYLAFLLLLLSVLPAAASDAEPDSARIYTTREERREAGGEHEVTDWLTLTALLELEAAREWQHTTDAGSGRDDTFNGSFQLGSELAMSEALKLELVYEYDHEDDSHTLDEAFIALDRNAFELEFGRLYLPFGQFYSQFATGPVLEFGETRTDAVVLNYSNDAGIDASLFASRGEVSRTGHATEADWGMALELALEDYLLTGVALMSDLAEADGDLLEEADSGEHYAHRVPALGGWLALGAGDYELTLELVAALSGFSELPTDRDRPVAWNLELGGDLYHNASWALRLEGSRELADAPYLQTGLALSWRFGERLGVTLEYLYGRYREALAEDDGGDSLHDTSLLAMQASLAL
jgi:hypothetical protein